MISNNVKYIKNMGVYNGFVKNETATMFCLKKPSLVYSQIKFRCLRADCG